MKPHDRLAGGLAIARKTLARARARRRQDDAPITAERIERALVLLAHMIANGQAEAGTAQLLDRLEAELNEYKHARDPIGRARAILEQRTVPAIKPTY